jgi:hypothetical protein
MKNQLALLDWDQAVETANRIITMDPHCLEALKVKVLSLICRAGNYEEASLNLRHFMVRWRNLNLRTVNYLWTVLRYFHGCVGEMRLYLLKHTALLREPYNLIEIVVTT